MAIVANTFTSFSAKGIREELSDGDKFHFRNSAFSK